MATLNPFDSDFKLSICDGPTPPKGISVPEGYVPCDFNGMMMQAQFLINAMIMLGTLLAVLSFTVAGIYYLQGGKKKDQAISIFKNVGIGFIMMLTAWFVVYQILDWFVANPGVKSLLGNP